MKEETAIGGATPPAMVQYEYYYDYNYQSETQVKAKEVASTTTKEGASTASSSVLEAKSPLTLLSSAASAVISDESSASASSSPRAAPPHEIPVHRLQKQADRSTPGQPQHPRPPTFVVPQPSAFVIPSTIPIARMVPPRNLLSVPPLPHQSILAVFPQFPPVAAAQALPMPPGMEITLSHPPPPTITPPPPPPAKAATAGMVPENATVLNTRKSSLMYPHHRGFGAAKVAPPVPSKASRANSKYKMKYHYISMRRWEAYRYIESLSKGSGLKPQQSHYILSYPNIQSAIGAGVVPGGAFPTTAPPPLTRPEAMPISQSTAKHHPPVASSVATPY